MQRRLSEINEALPEKERVQIRIGINSGRLIAGVFGSRNATTTPCWETRSTSLPVWNLQSPVRETSSFPNPVTRPPQSVRFSVSGQSDSSRHLRTDPRIQSPEKEKIMRTIKSVSPCSCC
jgi:hypothetical protein